MEQEKKLLQEAEAIVEALRNEEVDAVLGRRDVAVLRLRQAEAALRESEHRYRTLFESLSEGVLHGELIYGESGQPVDYRLIQINPAFGTLLAVSPEEATGKTARQCLPYMEPHPVDLYEKTLHTGEPIGFERYLPRCNQWLRFQVFKVTDHRFGLLVENITVRKEAERALAETLATLEERVKEQTGALIRKQAELRAMISELTVTEQRERRRIATQMHDYLAQLLVVSRLKLQQMERRALGAQACQVIEEIDRLLDEAVTYTRTLMADLSPDVLYRSGFPSAIKWLAEHMQRYGLRVTCLTTGEIDGLSEDQAVVVFQVVRELLFNVLKHAKIDTAQVHLRSDDGVLFVTVSDDGQGFDPTKAIGRDEASTFGLSSIAQRLLAIGGTFDLTSVPGQGTSATLRVPLDMTNRPTPTCQ